MIFDIKALFGDKESLTAEDLTEAVKGAKFVDLNDGEYVSKAKYEDRTAKLQEKVDELTAELDKKPNDDGTASELAAVKDQLAKVQQAQAAAEAKSVKLEHEKLVGEKVSDKRFARLALLDAEALVNDDTSFEEALEKVINDNPDYVAEADEDEPPARVRTGEPAGGKPGKAAELVSAVDAVFDTGKPKE